MKIKSNREWQLWELDLLKGDYTKKEISEMTGRSVQAVSSKVSKECAKGNSYKTIHSRSVTHKMRVLDLYQKGKSIKYIADKLNLRETWVRIYLGQQKKVEKNYTEDEVRFIFKSAEQGLAFEYIAGVLKREAGKVRRKYRDMSRELKNGTRKL